MKVLTATTTTTTTTKKKKKKKKMDLGEEEKEGGSGRTVVVGVRMDAQSKELLTWALVMGVMAGDRVVALHVLTKSSFSDDPDGNSPSSMISIIEGFDSMVRVYEGFCNLKQIDLKLKVCRGPSIRKVLVREANGLGAAKVILGVTKSQSVTGIFSSSVAKYCARKLPRECCVVAVNNGKIVLQREAMANSNRFSQAKVPGSNKENRSEFLNGYSNEYCLLPDSRDESAGSIVKDVELPSTSNSPRFSCSVCSSTSSLSQGDDMVESSSFLLPVEDADGQSSPNSILPSAHVLPETRCPLISRIVKGRKTRTSEETRMPVVRWAMRLPARYSALPVVHTAQKQVKPSKNGTIPAENGSVPARSLDKEKVLKISKELEHLRNKCSSSCRLFSYLELSNATSAFSVENLIGKGGNSHVYKGRLSEGRELAVKVLKKSKDVEKEFSLEIEISTTLQHMNIVSLIGFCFENETLMLVYDFFSRGSLEKNLHDVKGNKTSLNWADRYRIAFGIAEALDYLHSGRSGQPVIHRDVKSSNILLSDDLEPQLCDFGLASWTSSSVHITGIDVKGTFGYLAPEYFFIGKVNEKIDVYAFGVVLLELISGRKPIEDDFPRGQQSLVMWARPFLQSGRGKELLDLSLRSEYDNDQLERMLLAASLCIRRSPKLRPKMALMLKLLRGDEDTMKIAKLQFNTSEELERFDESIPYSSPSDIQSHLSLALLDLEEDMFSFSSESRSVDCMTDCGSMEAYLSQRWSNSSSFC